MRKTGTSRARTILVAADEHKPRLPQLAFVEASSYKSEQPRRHLSRLERLSQHFYDEAGDKMHREENEAIAKMKRSIIHVYDYRKFSANLASAGRNSKKQWKDRITKLIRLRHNYNSDPAAARVVTVVRIVFTIDIEDVTADNNSVVYSVYRTTERVRTKDATAAPVPLAVCDGNDSTALPPLLFPTNCDDEDLLPSASELFSAESNACIAADWGKLESLEMPPASDASRAGI